MYNWSTDSQKLKENKEKYTIWKLEQLVNFGLNEEKINAKELKEYIGRISIDPIRRKLLELLLAQSS